MIRTYITKINNEWYAFAADMNRNQVYSIGADQPPKDSGAYCYFANWTDGGVRYVASPSPSRKAAYAKAKRHGDYYGEV